MIIKSGENVCHCDVTLVCRFPSNIIKFQRWKQSRKTLGSLVQAFGLTVLSQNYSLVLSLSQGSNIMIYFLLHKPFFHSFTPSYYFSFSQFVFDFNSHCFTFGRMSDLAIMLAMLPTAISV